MCDLNEATPSDGAHWLQLWRLVHVCERASFCTAAYFVLRLMDREQIRREGNVRNQRDSILKQFL